MVKLGWLALAQLLVGDACFLAMFLALIFAARGHKSAPVTLQIVATGFRCASTGRMVVANWSQLWMDFFFNHPQQLLDLA